MRHRLPSLSSLPKPSFGPFRPDHKGGGVVFAVAALLILSHATVATAQTTQKPASPPMPATQRQLSQKPPKEEDKPSSDLIGEIRHHTVAPGETQVQIAVDYHLGYSELLSANPGIDPWIPPVGTVLTLPGAHLLPNAPHKGIVINLADQRLYYFTPDGHVRSMAIGIGRDGWETPDGVTTITRKRKDPPWYPPQSIRDEHPGLPKVVAAGPDNPLGRFALRLGWPTYLIHGTAKPYTIGRRATHGCIRLYDRDIEYLFDNAPIGTPVRVVDQPVKAGWDGDRFLVEIHPPQEHSDAVENGAKPGAIDDETLTRTIAAALFRPGHPVPPGEVDWPLIRRLAHEQRGIPVDVLKPVQAKSRAQPIG
jgi:L,D-transpeptidase ErfK/SrfK